MVPGDFNSPAVSLGSGAWGTWGNGDGHRRTKKVGVVLMEAFVQNDLLILSTVSEIAKLVSRFISPSP